mgnify:CR=1 FL=1
MTNFNTRIADKISKLSDSQIQSLFESLSADNLMLNSIIESLTSGVIVVDKDWIPQVSNKAFERLIPLSMHGLDAANEKINLFKITKDKDIAEYFKNCCELNKTNISEEFTVSTANGTVRFITITISPLVTNDELTGTIIVVRDITEKRNQEILLHRMESLASLTNLAASVAHEIKNPLGAISIHIQLLQKAIAKGRENDNELPDKKFVENYIDVVNEEIDNLNKIVVDFLFAVRPVSANLELLHPDSIIEKLIDFLRPEYEKENISVDVSLCPEDTRLLLDEKLFREVVVNLCQNAMHALNENSNSKNKKIEINSVIRDDKYFLTVSDNGCGIPEEKLNKIFEPYYTTKATGTGLGLTTVYKIVKEFSGDVSVKSVEGEGTSFVISLPVPQLNKKLLAYNKSESDKGEK